MRRIAMGLASALCLAAVGCADVGADEAYEAEESIGEVELELTNVPNAVQCVRVVVTGPATTTRNISVAPGASSASLLLGDLPLGASTFTGTAYAQPCSASGFPSIAASWKADPATANLRAGVVTTVQLTFRPISPVSANANFVGNIADVLAGSSSTWFRRTDGTASACPNPGWSSALTSVAKIVVGGGHTCVLKTDGTVWCAGDTYQGQWNSVPVQVTGLGYVSDLAAGFSHTCAAVGATTYCWGAGGHGQLGGQSTSNSATPVLVQRAWGGTLYSSGALFAGGDHTCRLSGGTFDCWGRNDEGQLGDGTTTPRLGSVYGNMRNITALTMGWAHTCALRADGGVRCWGAGYDGQLGNGSTARALTPVAVTGLSDATHLASAGTTVCALRSDKTVVCWGSNVYGLVGNGTGVDATTPVAVAGLANVQTLRAGLYHFVAQLEDLTVVGWGNNQSGQMCDNNSDVRFRPAPIVVP